MKYVLIITLGLCLMMAGCKDKTEECAVVPETDNIKVDLLFEQFQDSLLNVRSKDEMVALFTRQPMIRDYIFRRTEYPNDSVFINEVYSRLQNPHLDTLLMETKRVFGDLSSLKGEFEQAFKNIKYYYPNFYPPKVQTVISGLDTDLLVSDSLIIVGLDFYLGKGAKYRPKYYEYLLRKYDPNDIVPSSMLIYGISDRFNKVNGNDKTVLADMIAYGKSFYFAKHMLPCVPDSVLIWYTPEEIQGSRKNQNLIWARFVESEVLYSTSHVVKKDYLGERPVTIQVGEKCPGRIGQWMGWQIVNKYRETHPDLSLPQIMQMPDAQKIFKESKYKPERK
jgi:gliding motility-associated lipoprotein GldB